MIQIEGLSKDFGSLHAVRDLSVTVPRGELFCFLGPNGAGKTTTLKMLTGLLKPTAGRALIGGFDIQKEPEAAKRIMAYVPDMPFLYERLTTTEMFLFTGDLYGMDRRDVLAELGGAFAFFGLDSYRAALVKDLSHGLRQRLVYALAFLHRPKVLFIDEPLVGLDPYSIRTIKDLLRAKAREGMTIFLTTHILSLAEDVADRIGIIFKGKLIALGSLEDLRAQAGHSGDLEEVFLALTRED